jgi:hypothetical protein
LKNLDGLQSIVAAERNLRLNSWQVVELYESILGKALAQIIGQRLRSSRISR